jgi:hypothetical protein
MARQPDPVPVPLEQAPVWGRLYWDDVHPCPWLPFANISSFLKWKRDVRAARPDTKVEYILPNPFGHTPEGILKRVKELSQQELI